MLLLWILLELSFKLCKKKWLLNIYRTLLGKANVLMKMCRRRREEEYSGSASDAALFLADKLLCTAKRFSRRSVHFRRKEYAHLQKRLVP